MTRTDTAVLYRCHIGSSCGGAIMFVTNFSDFVLQRFSDY